MQRDSHLQNDELADFLGSERQQFNIVDNVDIADIADINVECVSYLLMWMLLLWMWVKEKKNKNLC